MSNPVSAAVTDANEFVANGAQITAEDGSVSGLGFGDRDTIADDELRLQYEGFEQDGTVPVDFTLEVRGANSPQESISGETTEAFSAATPDPTTFETIATENGVTFSPVTDGGGLAGEVTFGWNEAFTTATENGSELIAVTNDSDIGSDGNNGSTGHSALLNGDFSSTTDDGTRVRELVVRVTAEIDNSGNVTNAVPDGVTLTDSDTARVLIVVNNRQAALVGDVADGIGGQGSMQLNSTNVINSSENETAIDDSGNPLP